MVHQASVGKVTVLIAAMQHHVAANHAAGFNDIAASVEELIAKILGITDDLKLKNMNLIQANYPAIDLADDERKVAVQVTSDVTSEKYRETLSKFEAHGLFARYPNLKIIGFCKAVKPREMPAHVQVHGPEFFLGAIRSLGQDQLDELEQILRKSYDFSKLQPLRDEHCFSVVLRVLDRDAIRHYTNVEGSYSDFSKAIKEIKSIINAGMIEGKAIYAKPISQYADDYQSVLYEVDHRLGQMLAEVNRSKQGSIYCLTGDQRIVIDRAREEIIYLINGFCEQKRFPNRIRGIR
jgi:hypothetical protein